MAKLASLRIEKGWTQTELAKEANVPQSTVSRIEAGIEVGFSPKTMKRIADALAVKISEIDEFVPKLQGKNLPAQSNDPAGRNNTTASGDTPAVAF